MFIEFYEAHEDDEYFPLIKLTRSMVETPQENAYNTKKEELKEKVDDVK